MQNISVDGQLCGTIGKAQAVNTISCGKKLGRSAKVQLNGKDYLTLCEVEVWGSAGSSSLPHALAHSLAPVSTRFPLRLPSALLPSHSIPSPPLPFPPLPSALLCSALPLPLLFRSAP